MAWPTGVLHTGDNCNIDGGDLSHGGYLIPGKWDDHNNRALLLIDGEEKYMQDEQGNYMTI